MRTFYIFECDPYLRGHQSLVNHELAGFDYLLLRRGERIGHIPADLCLYVSDKSRVHLLGNPFGWKIMSEEAINIVREFVSESDIQLIAIRVLNEKTKKPVEGYFLVNCLRVIAALPSPHLEGILPMDRVVITNSQVPLDANLFLLREWPRHWVISESLWGRLSKLTGFDAIKITVTE